MRIAEDIKPLDDMTAHGADLLRQVGETRRPIVITQRGEAKGVLLDVESYQALRDASLLFKMVGQAEEDVAAGRLTPQDEVFASIRARLKERSEAAS